MNFDEWLAHPNTKVLQESIAKDYVPRTDLVTAVAAEREACAKVCDERRWRGEPLNFAEYCAYEIRMRSNAELTG